MRAHAHATAQRALDFPALLRKNGFAILMFDFEVNCLEFILIFEVYFNEVTTRMEHSRYFFFLANGDIAFFIHLV